MEIVSFRISRIRKEVSIYTNVIKDMYRYSVIQIERMIRESTYIQIKYFYFVSAIDSYGILSPAVRYNSTEAFKEPVSSILMSFVKVRAE